MIFPFFFFFLVWYIVVYTVFLSQNYTTMLTWQYQQTFGFFTLKKDLDIFFFF